MQTTVSLSKAAEMVGIQRSTLYRHIDEKPISVIKEEGAHPKIDVSELIRVYGDKVTLSREDNKKEEKNNRPTVSDHTKNDTVSYKMKIIELETRLASQEKHERSLEDQVDYLKDQLNDEKMDRKKANALLTDQRERIDNSQEWKTSLKAMEARMSNQEKGEKDRAEREEKILRQNKSLRKKLEEEKNKSFFQRLFG